MILKIKCKFQYKDKFNIQPTTTSAAKSNYIVGITLPKNFKNNKIELST